MISNKVFNKLYDVSQRIKSGERFYVCFRRGTGFIEILGHKESTDGYVFSFYNRSIKHYEKMHLQTLYNLTGKIKFEKKERILK